MIPSQSAMTYVTHQLLAMYHKAMKDAIVFDRCKEPQAATSLRLQAHDFYQVATFLGERIVKEIIENVIQPYDPIKGCFITPRPVRQTKPKRK